MSDYIEELSLDLVQGTRPARRCLDIGKVVGSERAREYDIALQ